MPRGRTKKKPKPLATQVPNSWKGTGAEWRMFKRGEWQQVVRAMSQFEFGCAYTPVGSDFYYMQRAAARISEAMCEDWVFQ
jgi:hypothetical protein